MRIIKKIQELKKILKNEDKTIGFVPTMGALHQGHLSLIERCVKENELCIVSIFVNPTQFLKGEDFQKYPKKEEADLKICQLAGVDIVFMPNKDEIYKDDELGLKAPVKKGFILEGFKRPGHFDGVLQVVCKFFNILNPTRAYFGKKDAQQLYLIKKMVNDLFMDIEIVECDLIRDVDGLALSSRNAYLSKADREKAKLISKSIKRAGKNISSGILDTAQIVKNMQDILIDVDVEYISIVDRDFNKIDKIKIGDSIILVAATVSQVRLIDNIWV